ncbi:unnamed protein product, partial [Adineta steineri]
MINAYNRFLLNVFVTWNAVENTETWLNSNEDYTSNTIIACYPHGRWSFNLIYQLCHPRLANIGIATHTGSCFVPANAIIMALLGKHRSMTVSKRSINKNLQIAPVAIVPGGGREAMLCNPNEKNVIRLYTKHIGFLKLAMENKSKVVPCFTFATQFEYNNILRVVDSFLFDTIGFPLNFLIPMGKVSPLLIM